MREKRTSRGFCWMVCLVLILLNSSESVSVELDKDRVFFPQGEFEMGSDEGVGQKDERPKHRVFLDAFWMDRYEVSGKDFEEFLSANPKQHPPITGWHDRKVRPGMENRPVIGLSWKRCKAYCEFRGKRLPTEAEWERAAGGVEKRPFPWGNEIPDDSRANYNKCCFIQRGEILDSVDSRPKGATPEGIYNMAGNIAEWVFDWYGKNYYKNSPLRNPKGPRKGKYHVIRGGAWNSYVNYMRTTDRYGYNDGQDFYGIGCRCAQSATPKSR